MSNKESYRERQISELEVIKSIFGKDVEDLQSCSEKRAKFKWKPINIRITLTPLRDCSNGPYTEVYVKTKLHIVCSSKYPKVSPRIYLEESNGISDVHIDQLLEQLQQQAQASRDKEMIYDLTQTVQAFLVKHNKPQCGSLYDEMLQQKQQREQKRLDMQKQRETLERQTRIDEVEKRKELFKCEASRKEPRRSMSESNRTSSPESSDKSVSYHRGPVYPIKCLEHRNSEILRFHKVGRQIRRGCCLGHSQKGCIAYTGIDIDTGQLLYITEWTIKYSHIEKLCLSGGGGGGGGKCIWLTSSSSSEITKCSGNHRVDDIIAGIEKHVTTLSQLHHKHLIQYECVLCVKRKEGLVVYLVQDFVLGTSVFSISSSLGWCMDGVRGVAKGVLDALVFLHNRGVSHSHLLDSTVFMDNTGTIRCSDFSLVPILLELISEGTGDRCNLGDLPALGALLESLVKLPTIDMKDFLEKCNSRRTLTASELLEHPFLRPSIYNTTEQRPENDFQTQQIMNFVKNPNMLSKCQPLATVGLVNVPAAQLLPTSHESRLDREFKILKHVGKGGFGDVLKVRNILDNREYAIKRIRLPARSKRLLLKITREVELLSRLNHENVVRYFNSWIEEANQDDVEKMESLDWSPSKGSRHKRPSSTQKHTDAQLANSSSSSSSCWNALVPNVDDTDSDGIEFIDSKGEKPNYDNVTDGADDGNNAARVLTAAMSTASLKPLGQVMYIQMEFCENCTLRTAIDDNLHQNTERLWRFFREIAEGLSHIHQQGIIHRDLKPLNIFLDSRDQIKIGDFGLATTSFLALQTHTEHMAGRSAGPRGGILQMAASLDDGTSTGKVGTALYVAPELTGNASKSTYNQKVDMYTLGIILFEMCQPPFPTAMERIQTIINLRSPEIVIPDTMLNDNRSEKTVKLLRWLLSHEPEQRPTAEELLASDLVPPAQLEASELQEMLKNALANPQSKSYKHIVARCLQQQSDEILEHTYHFGAGRTFKSWSIMPGLEYLKTLSPLTEVVKAKVLAIFRKHGGIEVDTPLLSPLTQQTSKWCNPVRLMTHSGCVVVLPTDLRTQFVRHIAMSGVNWIRRYCVGRTFREEKVFNFHPKQNYECAFDIISPHAAGSHLVDAELMFIAYEVARIMPHSHDGNVRIHMNHSNLLKSVLMHFNVPKAMYDDLFGNILDVMEGRMSKFQFHSAVTRIMEKTTPQRNSPSALADLLFSSFQMCGKNTITDAPALKCLMRGNSEAAILAKAALREMESVVTLAQSLGVKCPIHIVAGLPNIFEGPGTAGINWQLIVDFKSSGGTSRPSVLAVGGRYDTLLKEFQKQAQRFNFNEPKSISGAGITFFLDKLVQAVGWESNDFQKYPALNVAVCVQGSRPPLKDVTSILRLLWSLGGNVRCAFVESVAGTDNEAQDLAELGTSHIILVAENGSLRIRSWERERFQERQVTFKELTEFIQKMQLFHETIPTTDHHSLDSMRWMEAEGGKGDGCVGATTSSTNIRYHHNNTNLNNLPRIQVRFLTQDKLTANYKRRYENQVSSTMSSTLAQFARNETVVVLVVELPSTTLNAIVGAINPRDLSQKTEQEINFLIERFPKHRRYINEIWNEVADCLSDSKITIVALYSIHSESYYRVIF